MRLKTPLLFFLLIILFAASKAGAVNIHELNGSDLGLGVGARAMSMGGAFTALADDTSALYWNPAGITEMPRNEAMFMADIDPLRYSYKATVLRPKKWDKSDLRPTFGIGRTNRLKYIADGDWSQGNASYLIDLSMINVERNYVGGLNSRTKDYRYTFASRVPQHEKLSIGLTYINFKCVTTFYMIDPQRICQTVAYDTFDFGFLYRASEKKHYGLSVRNPVEVTKPKYLNIGYAAFKGRDTYTFDVEHIFGHYSNEERSVNFLMLRAGMERDIGNGWKLRGGLVAPIRARTTTLGDIRAKIPSPKLDATFGAGYTHDNKTVDLVIFGDSGQSFVENSPKFSSAVTLRYKY